MLECAAYLSISVRDCILQLTHLGILEFSLETFALHRPIKCEYETFDCVPCYPVGKIVEGCAHQCSLVQKLVCRYFINLAYRPVLRPIFLDYSRRLFGSSNVSHRVSERGVPLQFKIHRSEGRMRESVQHRTRSESVRPRRPNAAVSGCRRLFEQE